MQHLDRIILPVNCIIIVHHILVEVLSDFNGMVPRSLSSLWASRETLGCHCIVSDLPNYMQRANIGGLLTLLYSWPSHSGRQ